MPTVDLNRRELPKLRPEPGCSKTYYDAKLRGFGLRFYASGVASWILDYRTGAGQKRRYVLGGADTLAIGVARAAARKLLARIELGANPQEERQAQRRAEKVGDLFDSYLREHCRPKLKPRTVEAYRQYVEGWIKPAWRSRSAAGIARADVQKLHRSIAEFEPRNPNDRRRGGRGVANRVLVFISGAFTWGAESGLLPEGHPNPARGVKRFPENANERFLVDSELARLGEALRLAETTGIPWAPRPSAKAKHAPKPENRLVKLDPWAIAAVRLLMFTGCRLREILHLRWSDVDLERGFLFLPDSKTGRKPVVLNAPAMEVLASLERLGVYVIAGAAAGQANEKPRADLQRPWARITEHAGLGERGKKGEKDYRPGLRLHDLRHSHAAVGAASGASLQIIGKLLGHKRAETTARYAHLADDPVRSASEKIGARLKATLEGKSATVVAISGVAE